MFFSKLYSLRKSRHIFRSSYKLYEKKNDSLSLPQQEMFKSQLHDLDTALQAKDRAKSDALARSLESFCNAHFTKTWWEYAVELTFAIAIAIAVATIVRASWFEPYEIPTGSMRPTFEEQDRLTVTKTAFGLNVPLKTAHFYFDPSLVQRTGVVIWSGDGIPHLDSESTFMGIFPYTKRFIKRCIAKPGDTLYFYGGKIYGIDKDGNEIKELIDSPWMAKLEHIPFIHYEGRMSSKTEQKQNQLMFHQINQLIGRLTVSSNNKLEGEIFNGKEWIKDDPAAQKASHDSLKTYSDFWGIGNFAMARLLTKEQVEATTSYKPKESDNAILYLELKHTPNLKYNPSQVAQRYLMLNTFHTVIPLREQHLKAIMNNMYTARFVVKDGMADRYRLEGGAPMASSLPRFPNVADGTYEFYYGKGYRVGWQGILSALPADHPLYKFSAGNVQKLYNLGIEVSTMYNPAGNRDLFPNRYAYFRDGDLYLLGAPILKASDPVLKEFMDSELKKEKEATTEQPYVAFRDHGAPLKEGKINKEFLDVFGYKVPEGHYLVLGDNHAMSQDSRYFGPIPQANLQGAPSLILWPPGERWGFPSQKPYPLITLPRLIVWGIVALLTGLWYLWHRRRWEKASLALKN